MSYLSVGSGSEVKKCIMMNVSDSGRKIQEFHVSDMVELQLLSSSKGNQRKWYLPDRDFYIKEQFFYQGRRWGDYLVEIISSEIGMQLPKKCAEVLKQQECIIIDYAGKFHGVYSRNFAHGLNYVSFKRLIDENCLYFDERAGIGDKWEFVLDSIKRICKIDYTAFLITMTLMDFLVGNEDRHLNNFGVLYENGVFSLSPVFDFGLGLFEHDLKYDGVPFKKCLSLMRAKPFHSDNQKVIDYVTMRYNIHEYLPAKIDLHGIQMPSAKAGSYLRNRCMYLGIALEGVE